MAPIQGKKFLFDDEKIVLGRREREQSKLHKSFGNQGNYRE